MLLLRPVSGGMRRHVANLLGHMDLNKIYPFVVGPANCFGDLEDSLPREIPLIPLRIDGEPHPVNDLRNSWTIARLARENKIDIIHAHGYKAGLLSWLVGLQQVGRFALLCTFHNPLSKTMSGPKDFALKTCAAWTGRQADHIVTVSEALRSEAVQILKIPEQKVSCVHNGIDPDPFRHPIPSMDIRREWKVDGQTVVVGTSARLIRQKGVQYLIKAASKLIKQFADLRFVIVGDGPEKANLEAEAGRLGVYDKFVFTGYRTDMPDLLGAMDVFVQPSLEEGFSIAALEAMAAGKPVVASAVDGIPEVVTGGETGILVPPGDDEALSQAIGGLIQDSAKRQRMGEAGKARAEAHFTLAQMIEGHYEIYEELKGRKQRD